MLSPYRPNDVGDNRDISVRKRIGQNPFQTSSESFSADSNDSLK